MNLQRKTHAHKHMLPYTQIAKKRSSKQHTEVNSQHTRVHFMVPALKHNQGGVLVTIKAELSALEVTKKEICMNS